MRLVTKREDVLVSEYITHLHTLLASCNEEKNFWRDKVLNTFGVVVPTDVSSNDETQIPVSSHSPWWPTLKKRLERSSRKTSHPTSSEVDNNRKPDGMSDEEFAALAEKASEELNEL